MANNSPPAMVKDPERRTGFGMMVAAGRCPKQNGDMEAAIDWLGAEGPVEGPRSRTEGRGE